MRPLPYRFKAVRALGLLVLQFWICIPAVVTGSEQSARLQESMLKARDELEWPGPTVDEAARNLKTAEQALAFVRDGIGHVA